MTRVLFNPALALLQCRDVGGAMRYELPAVKVGPYEGYEVFWRPAPAPLWHERKGRILRMHHAELLLVGLGLCHCISFSVAASGVPVGAYVNINLPPQTTDRGWAWEDLELDVKVRADCADNWMGIVVDHDEFLAAPLTQALRRVAEEEVVRVLQHIATGEFPFGAAMPWLGVFESPPPCPPYVVVA